MGMETDFPDHFHYKDANVPLPSITLELALNGDYTIAICKLIGQTVCMGFT